MTMRVGPIVQHGYVVADAAQTARAWAERLGVGPFYLIEQPVDEYVFRGARVDLRLCIGVSYWGDTQIELIQPLGGEVSLYSEAVDTAPGQLNHYAVMVPDIDAAVTNHHLDQHVVHRGVMPSLSFVYLENYLPDDSHLELMQAPPSTLQAFEAIKAVCRKWDGTRPVRTLEDLMTDLAALRTARP